MSTEQTPIPEEMRARILAEIKEAEKEKRRQAKARRASQSDSLPPAGRTRAKQQAKLAAAPNVVTTSNPNDVSHTSIVQPADNANSQEVLYPLGRDAEGQVRPSIPRQRHARPVLQPPLRFLPKNSIWADQTAQSVPEIAAPSDGETETNPVDGTPKDLSLGSEQQDEENGSPTPMAPAKGMKPISPVSMNNANLSFRTEIGPSAAITTADLMQLFSKQWQLQEARMAKFEEALLTSKTAPHPISAPRQIKIKEPTSWSSTKKSGDIIPWLNKVEAYVDTVPPTPEARKVIVASSFLEGSALEYWDSVKLALNNDANEITFKVFRSTLSAQYTDAFRQETAAEKLCTLKEVKGKLREYKSSFEDLTARLPTDPQKREEYLLIALYRQGLHPSTAARCAVNPTDGSKHTSLSTLKLASILAADNQALEDATDKAQKAFPTPKNPPLKRKFPDNGKPRKQLPRCGNCGAYGHIKEECRKPPRQYPPPPPPPAGRGQQQERFPKPSFQGKGKPRR